MSAYLIAAVGLVYLITSVLLYMEQKPGLAIAFLGYAAANAGLVIEALGK